MFRNASHRVRWLLVSLLLSSFGFAVGEANAVNIKFTASPPPGGLILNSGMRWWAQNCAPEDASYDINLAAGMTGHQIVGRMHEEMEVYGVFIGDSSVSGNTLTVATAHSGTFSAPSDADMSVSASQPCFPAPVLPPQPDLPFGYPPPPCDGCYGPEQGIVILYLTDFDGLPTLAGGSGTITISVVLGDSTTSPVFSNAAFTASESTTDILDALDAVFSAEPLPPGGNYVGNVDGSLVFYTDDLRPLSIRFETVSTDTLPLVTSAAIFYSYQDLSDVPGIAATAPSFMSVSPSPTSGLTEVRFDLPAAAPVLMSVVDVNGREVAHPFSGTLPAGPQALSWDSGAVTPGVYFLRIEAGGMETASRVLVVR